MTEHVARVLIYGDVNLNVVDGSAVWLPSVAEAWAIAGAEVHVQLKAPETRTILSGRLRQLENVTVHEAEPSDGIALSVAEVTDALARLHEQHSYDVILIRGTDACLAASEVPEISNVLWAYITEFGYGPEQFSPRRSQRLSQIAERSKRLLAQTPQARAVFEACVPAAAGRVLLLGPMIPDELAPANTVAESAKGTAENPLRLIYAGKFAKAWRTDLMPELVTELAEIGITAELTMIGDKVHREREHPDWRPRMQALMESQNPHVHWLGAKSREESLALLREADISLGWREPDLDLSLEISTKVLEACALGVPSLVNRTSAHEALFGANYPLLVDTQTAAPASVARSIAAALPTLQTLQSSLLAAAAPYRVSQRAADFRHYLRVLRPAANDALEMQASQQPTRPLKVLLAGHDLKFAGELIDLLDSMPNAELRIDHWETLHKHDEAASEKLLKWADVIICEWAGPNSVWYSQRKLPHQKLIVRLHMFEFRGAWLHDINVSEVDTFVTVSALTREKLTSALNVPDERIAVIPNAIAIDDFERQSAPDRVFKIGLAGFVPLLKRPDRAFDLLQRLRRHDDRFTLHLRGRLPWEYPHLWRKPEQRESYMEIFARLGSSPLREAVAFESFGPDMANWLSRIGWMLSPSTTESFHLAPVEGMAAGAIPVVWDRPGAREVFGDEFVVQDTAEAAEFILSHAASDERLAQQREHALACVRHYDIHAVQGAWTAAIYDS